MEIIKASEVKVQEIEWLCYCYIPYGKITVTQGTAKVPLSLTLPPY